MRSIFLLVVGFGPCLAVASECGRADPALFHNRAEVWEVQADFSQINDRSIELHEKARASSPGKMRVGDREYSVQVKARGKFRFEECSVRPISVELPASSEWGKQKLRLTTVCHKDAEWVEQATRDLMKELAIYKVTEELPGPHLATRLVQLRLKQPDGSLYLEAPAFLRESEKDLARRCGMRVREDLVHRWNQEKRTFERFLKQPDGSLRPWDYSYDSVAMTRMEFTNRLLNNIDYLVEEDHNVIPLVPKTDDRRIYLIPYDFDLSQAAGGTFYGFSGGAPENAATLKTWIGEDAFARDPMRLEFLSAWPRIRARLEEATIDSRGRTELLNWFETHWRALQ